MRDKISWQMIYCDFKKMYPRLSKDAIHYIPHGYLTIKVTMSDGAKLLYDYYSKKVTFLKSES